MTRRRARAQEQLLADGLPVDGPVARLLADASAPAKPHELEGLSAAVAAFSARRPGLRRSPVKSVLAKLLAAKVLASGVAAAGVGGIALAAATGSLPAPAQNAAHDLVGAPAAGSQAEGVRQDGNHRPDASATPDASPSPSLVGLCRAYGAGVADANGKALDNPAFTVLITAAGGKDGVPAYCATLLASAPGGKPTALPTQAQRHKPTAHPTGKPTSHPGATSHPTGKP